MPSAAASAPRTRLVGRDRELAELEAGVAAGARLVTLLGPPGAGKTRLARELAWRERDRRAVFFCDLTGCGTADALAAVLVSALGGQLGADAGPEAIGRAIARHREPLIVLDNFEQLAPYAAVTVGAWMDAAPAARFLVTSREALRIEGERRVALAGLADDFALAMYEERACAVAPHWPLADQRGDARALVRRLDGLPLAIELAAARIEILPPVRMMRELDRSFDALRSTTRDAPPHHHSLHAAIETSWRLLDPPERTALAHLGVFRGSFTLDAAGAIVDMSTHTDAPAVDVVVQSLVDRSLVRAFDDRLALYESIREHAATKLTDAGERRALEGRHAAFFVDQAERRARGVSGARGDAGLRWLEDERDNLTAAHERAVGERPLDAARAALALDVLVRVRGPSPLRQPFVEAALRCAERAGDPRWIARALVAFADVTRLAPGRSAAARESLERALALGVDEHDVSQVEARALLGAAVWDLGDLGGGLAHLERALERAEEIGERGLEAWVRIYLSAALTAARRTDEARASLERAARLARHDGESRTEAIALADIGYLALESGQLGTARDYLERALALLERAGDLRVGMILHNLGTTLLESGDADGAAHAFQRAIATHREAGRRPWEGYSSVQLAALEWERGRFDTAEEALRFAVALVEDTGVVRLRAYASAFLAALLARRGDWETHDRLRARADALAAETEDAHIAHALELLAAVASAARARELRARGQAAAAAPFLEAAERAASTVARAKEDARIAGRVLLADLTDLRSRAIQVGPGARWFELPGGTRVDMRRRGPPRRILLALAERRVAAPGRPMTAAEVMEAGWPGEKIMHEAGLLRVYTTVRLLRTLGLEACLVTVDDGYLIDSGTEIAFAVQ